ncbi:MAG: PAS domain-containing sensor histidine kinase [Chloroflexi bacterium]|nr:PAS domain-containing sensor histidine kinase [Chloroflexota bacterium]
MVQFDNGLKQRVAVLRWVMPIAFAALVVVYQLGFARWLHDNVNASLHFSAEVLFFGLTGPLLAFWSLTLVGHWLNEKEQAEQSARIKDSWLASITEASADAIISLDPEGRIESWNRGAALLLGYTAQEARGHSLADIFGGGGAAAIEAQWLARSTRRSGFVRGHETTILTAARRPIIVELTATHITADNGEPLGISLILRDITNRKRRQAEIEQLNASLNQQVAARTRELAEKVEELARANAELQKLDQTRAEFISLVSHQIRAPLTNIRGAVERIQNACCSTSPTCARMCAIIDQQVARLDRLVQDVLDANRIEAGELAVHLEPISAFPVARQVVAQMRSRLGERPIYLAERPGLPLIYADRDRLMEVLANLLDNADKYTPAGAPIFVDARANDAEVIIEVRDQGPGLPPAARERIFEKFYRTDNSDAQAAYGYGLGLYVCRRLMEAQNGRVWAENHPQGGAVFSVALPIWWRQHA